MKRTKEAFAWIIAILKNHKVPYRISGGFAARVYGSKRPLVDIDIEIPDRCFTDILKDIKPYIRTGPKRFKDKEMDTFGVIMEYKGQRVELSGTDTEKLFDALAKKWIKSTIDISKVTKKKVYGQVVSVIRKEDLLAYKRKLGRDVDVLDIKAIAKKCIVASTGLL
ncbi:hypothetical protein C4573_04125 [Candidatus Woesearchaeota archaeon]|nr:MAG: hypothetical protein C4573_04125 [Candidatus Woesearchaeota archaeon]